MTEASRLAPGTRIAGEYEIERLLAEGGMGAVYVARQASTGRARALKVMLPAVVADPKNRERFVQEAKVGATIDSDHVVEVVGAGIDATSGIPWLAMELLDGADLAAVVARQGPVEPRELLALFEQLGHALGAAHRVGVVHRDLKPENVFLARSRRAGASYTVKVLDFGIARMVQAAQTSAAATSAIGSPLWMAPEQLRGGRIDPTTDVWALGLVAFWALSGKSYWRGAHRDDLTLEALLLEKLLDPLEAASLRAAAIGGNALPAGFDAWFARCVVREQDARFADASVALAELRPVLEASPAASGPGLATTLATLGTAATVAPTLVAPTRVPETRVVDAGSPPAVASTIAMTTVVSGMGPSGSVPLTSAARGSRWRWFIAPAALLSIAVVGWRWNASPAPPTVREHGADAGVAARLRSTPPPAPLAVASVDATTVAVAPTSPAAAPAATDDVAVPNDPSTPSFEGTRWRGLHTSDEGDFRFPMELRFETGGTVTFVRLRYQAYDPVTAHGSWRQDGPRFVATGRDFRFNGQRDGDRMTGAYLAEGTYHYRFTLRRQDR